MKTRLLRIAGKCAMVLSSCLLLFACNGDDKTAYAKNTAFVGIKADFDSFNELNASDSDALQVISNMLFMSLARLDSNLNWQPYLAESWSFTHGDSVLTFKLRTDVFWTDGAPTTAEDVAFTWRMAIDDEVAYPAVSRFDLTDTVEVLNKYTVRFCFKQPYPDILSDVAMPILPRHLLEQIPVAEISRADFNRNPIGNGPYMLARWDANSTILFDANPTWCDGKPPLDRIAFIVIPDEATRLANLATGELDIVSGLSPLAFAEVQGNSALRALRCAGRGFTFIGWNNDRPALTREVRRALSRAIDKKAIINTLFSGYAIAARGPLMPFSWAFDHTLPENEFNPGEAARLLGKAGWRDSDGDGIVDKDGKPLSLIVRTNADNQLRRDTAVMIQQQLARAGVDLQLDLLEFNQLIFQVFEKRDFDALILGWDTDFTVNPTDLWHSKAIDEGYNLVSYRNAAADSLLEAGRSISVPDSARDTWKRFQWQIVEDAPYTFLFIPETLSGVSGRMRQVSIDPRGLLAEVLQWRIAD